MKDKTLYRYDLPSIDGLEGWGTVVLGADGFFSAVTDYGNYAYRWRSWGDADFRERFVQFGRDYLLSKIAEQVYSHEKTVARISARIAELIDPDGYEPGDERPEIDEAIARERELLESHDPANEVEFVDWYRETELPDAYELMETDYTNDARAFADRFMPRLREVILQSLVAAVGDVR